MQPAAGGVRLRHRVLHLLALLTVAAAPMLPLESIRISGSEHSAQSIAQLAGLRTGQPVNEEILQEACRRLEATGFFESLHYYYLPGPNKRSYILVLELADQHDVLPARLEVPSVSADDVWTCLKRTNPVFFTREVPASRKGIAYYAKAVEACTGKDGLLITGAVTGAVGIGRGLEVVFRPAK